MSQRARPGDKETKRQGECLDGLLSPCLPVSCSILVIGYGNELRGDDAVGQRVARTVGAWNLPGVRALAVHQLTPELAEDLAHAHDAIFVDAYRADAIKANVSVRPIIPGSRCDLSGHFSDPSALLALAQAIYGRDPRAWLIAVPATSCEYGADFSRGAEAGISRALYLVRALVMAQRDVLCMKSD